ncbi:MAG: hypothetical protein NT118_09640, partial [Lentisphaerae bacterium]|nr:hypothetical protein [Lentisphaerota bacterium]
MRATPLSKKQYFPMLLSNGRNAALVDYGGSMLSAITGHAHFTQHQNAACGWYKVANSWKGKLKVIEKVAACGYQVILNGEFCEPIHFVQRFNPKKAILKTEVLFFLNIRLVIESFMTDDDILVENYKFIFIPDNCKLDFTTVVLDPSKILIGPSLPESSSKISSWKSETDISQRAMRFSYQIDEISGYGEMYSDTTVNALGGWGDAGFEFQNLKSGGGMTRFVCISDSSEKTDYQSFVIDKIADCKKRGYKKIRSEHIGVWNGYFEQSSITIPDKESEYLYNLSRYMMRANLHPETGGLTVGMLPYIYGGGTYVPYDAWYMHQALLLTNNIKEAAKHLDYYQMQH